MKPTLSIVFNTYQELKPMLGSNIDIYKFLFDSLETQWFKDFEVIVVDGHYEERKTYLEYLMSQYKFPIKHIPPAPSKFFEDKKQKNNYQISRYRNSGFLLCGGSLVMFIDDCIVPSLDGSLAQMVNLFFMYGAIIKPMINRYRFTNGGAPVVEYDPNMSHVDQLPSHQLLMQGSGQQGGVYFFPSGLVETLNGFDEIFDGGKGSEDCDFNNRVDRSGVHRFYIANGELSPQYPFNLIEHNHKVLDGIDLCQCNEAYAQWIFKNTESRNLQANSKKLSSTEIEEIVSICKTDKCPTFREGSCRRQSGVNRTILESHNPVFDIANARQEMIEKFPYGSMSSDIWKDGNPLDTI